MRGNTPHAEAAGDSEPRNGPPPRSTCSLAGPQVTQTQGSPRWAEAGRPAGSQVSPAPASSKVGLEMVLLVQSCFFNLQNKC